MSVRKLSTLFIFIIAACYSSAQSTYHFRHLTMNDGITEPKVSSIVQDKYGTIWLGSIGLNKYNGHTMLKYVSDIKDSTSLPDMNIRRMYCTRGGNLYISTFTGFCRYDYLHNNFQRSPFGIIARDSRMIETEDGILWMNSQKGLVIANEKTNEVTELARHSDSFIRKIAKLHIYAFATDGKENIYLGSKAGLFVINYKTWTTESYQYNANDPISIHSNDIQNIVIDKNGMVWISADYYGSNLIQFDPAKKSFIYFEQLHTQQKEWIDNRILDLMIDSENRLWIATLRSSLVKFDVEKKNFRYFLHDPGNPSGVSSNTIYTLYEDRDKGIWLSAQNNGVDYFFPANNSFTTISRSTFRDPALADNWCQAVTEDANGNLWIGTYRGLSFYNRQSESFQNFFLAQIKSQDANNSIRSLQADGNGVIWIGTGNGLNKWNPISKKIESVNYSDSIPALFINYLGFDRQKRLMACTPASMYRFNKEKKKFENFFNRPVLAKYKKYAVYTAFQDSRNIYWLSLSNRGLLRYDEQKNEGQFFDFKTLNPQSLSLDYITSIAEDKNGIIWLSAINGLIAYDDEKKIFNRYYEEDGLPANKVSGLLVDSLNRLWMGSSKGLCMLEADRKSFHVFDEKDGLSNGYFYEGGAYNLHNGNFVYATYNGIVQFDPYTIKIHRAVLPAAIVSIRVSGRELNGELPVRELKQINLRPNESFFSIELEALNYSNPQSTLFAYKLEAFNEDWIYTKDRIINYTNVPGGKYIFRYKATANPRDWNVPEHQLEIFIATVFYKTFWFRLLVAMLLGLLIYGIVRYRFLQQQRVHALENKAGALEKEKALVMYENLKQHLNPHFLFNSLTSLRSLIRVDQKHAGDFLERMSKIYRYILKSRDSELVQLKDEISFVQTYIELQQTRFREGLQVKFNINDEHLHLRIVPVTLQNLIDNAIKHNLVDEETPLIVEIFVEDNYLVVRNNLQKKEFVETSNKQGLQNMRSLYQYLDSRPLIINEDQNYFTIKIPLI